MPRGRPQDPSYTFDEIGPLLGLGSHQLRGLVERRVIKPSVTHGFSGPGGKRRFNPWDLVAIQSSHELVRLGIVGHRLQRAVQAIQRLEGNGKQRSLLVIDHAGETLHVPRARNLNRLIRRTDGPYAHVVLDLSRIAQDVRRLLKRYHARLLCNFMVATSALDLSSWISSDIPLLP